MDLINIVLWIVFGALAGWIASIIMRTNAQMGGLANIIVGVIGAIIGGFIMNALGAEGVTGCVLRGSLVPGLGAPDTPGLFTCVPPPGPAASREDVVPIGAAGLLPEGAVPLGTVVGDWREFTTLAVGQVPATTSML